jgi:hypothetical protein
MGFRVKSLIASLILVGGSFLWPGMAVAHADCDDFWRHSEHTDRAQWHHCHDWQTYPSGGGTITQARVHICGFSGTLHGITVGHVHREVIPSKWVTGGHAHDEGGEGCRPR